MSFFVGFGRCLAVVGVIALLWSGCTEKPSADSEHAEEPAAMDPAEDVAAPEASEPVAEPIAPSAPVAPPPARSPSRAPAPASTAPEPPRPAPPSAPPASSSSTPARPEPPRSAPEPPRAPDIPEIVEVEVPTGTVLELELLTALDSSVQREGDEIQARTLSPLYVKGDEVLAAGTYVEGRVTEAQASGRVKGRARLGFTFDRLSTTTGVKKIRSSFVEREAEGGEKKDATIIGGAAGIGAVVGGIIGGKKGAAIGATVGGASGTGVVLTTRGEEIRLPVGTEINVRLDEPVTIQLN